MEHDFSEDNVGVEVKVPQCRLLPQDEFQEEVGSDGPYATSTGILACLSNIRKKGE